MNSEAKIQQEIFTWHWNSFPKERGLLFMVHNEARDRINGARLKSMGMVKGVSDMIYLNPRNLTPYFLEIKTEVGRQAKSQKDWENLLHNHGFMTYHLIRSLEEFKDLYHENITKAETN